MIFNGRGWVEKWRKLLLKKKVWWQEFWTRVAKSVTRNRYLKLILIGLFVIKLLWVLYFINRNLVSLFLPIGERTNLERAVPINKHKVIFPHSISLWELFADVVILLNLRGRRGENNHIFYFVKSVEFNLCQECNSPFGLTFHGPFSHLSNEIPQNNSFSCLLNMNSKIERYLCNSLCVLFRVRRFKEIKKMFLSINKKVVAPQTNVAI